jgi:hypothetical protein
MSINSDTHRDSELSHYLLYSIILCTPSGEAASTNVIIFCLTQPCLVRTIYRTRGEHIYHYTTDALILSMLMQWKSQKPAPLKTKGLVLVSSGKIFGIKCQPVVKNNLYIWLPVIISIVIGQE